MEMETLNMPQEKANILIVDDNAENLRLLSQTLEKNGYTVLPAKSGKMALTAVENLSPDLFLLDIMMPEMDGYELCRRLKDNDELKDIPVIFLTALGASEDIVKGFDLGAVDYVVKPFRIPELLSRVETHVKLRQTIVKLQDALDHIQTLEGILPICASCKKIRDERGKWNSIESYIRDHTRVDFSHGICPECSKRLYPDFKYPED